MTRSDGRTQWLWPLFLALATAGLLELMLLRVAYRVGLFVPRGGALSDAYGVATWVGSFAFDLTSMLGLVVLGGLAWDSWRRRRVEALALTVLLALAGALPFATAGTGDLTRLLFAAAALAAAVIAAAPALRRGAAHERVALLCVLIAVVSAQYSAAASTFASMIDTVAEPPLALEGIRLAEIAAVVAAFPLALAALSARRAGPVELALSCLATVAFAAVTVAHPYLSGIVLLWAAGVSLLLPLPAYAAALAAYTLTVVTESMRADRVHRAVATTLLLVAGVVPQSSAHVVVAILAIALLAEWPRSLIPVSRSARTTPHPGTEGPPLAR